MITLQRIDKESYKGGNLTLNREWGENPEGHQMNGKWALRDNGELIDIDMYRYDIAERNDLEINDNHRLKSK